MVRHYLSRIFQSRGLPLQFLPSIIINPSKTHHVQSIHFLILFHRVFLSDILSNTSWSVVISVQTLNIFPQHHVSKVSIFLLSCSQQSSAFHRHHSVIMLNIYKRKYIYYIYSHNAQHKSAIHFDGDSIACPARQDGREVTDGDAEQVVEISSFK